jgi:kumamolisin
MPVKRVTIPGTKKLAPPHATPVGEVKPDQRISVTVLLRRKENAALKLNANGVGQILSREAFRTELGADLADIAKIEAFAEAHSLSISEVRVSARTLKLSGKIADLEGAFKPTLKIYKRGKIKFRGRTDEISVPAELEGIIDGVFGFDTRPVAKPHFVMRPVRGKFIPSNSRDGSLSVLEIAKLYDFPTNLDGAGQCIAIIELGGGFVAKDLTSYFKSVGLEKPSVVAISVDGAINAPGDPADGEVMLDIEIAGAIAPKAEIAVDFAPNTDQGFLNALLAAIHDNRRKPSVVSISWGAPEDLAWTQQALDAFNGALQDAATLGVTVCCASGDDGSSDIRNPAQRDGKLHVDFPASSPFALACGGTKLIGSNGVIQSETVWNGGGARGGATGGGVSQRFDLPTYQTNSSVPKTAKGTAGRGVPDVAGNADPATGYQVFIDGKDAVIGGTSAVAPLLAGLLALINQRRSGLGKTPVGFLQPKIYQNQVLFRDITEGSNDIENLQKFVATVGWDACTGLGSVNGKKLLALLEE